MNDLKLLSKIFACTFFLTLFSSCSSDVDEINDAINGVDKDSKVSMKIDNSTYQEHFDSNPPNYDKKIHTFNWSQNSYGEKEYSVSGYIDSVEGISLAGSGYVSIKLGKDIKQGQVFNINSSGFDFQISFNGLSNSVYFLQDTTIGQLKVTYFDGVTMSAEFSFEKIEQTYDNNKKKEVKITGNFTKIEKYKS